MAVIKENNIRYENTFWRMEDYDLFYRMRNLTSTTNLNFCLYNYRKGAYNENLDINQKKLTQFEKLYFVILKHTGIDPDPEMLKTHMELNRLLPPSNRIGIYKKHCEEILRSNLKTKNFPHQRLQKVLKISLHQMIYRLMDANKIKFSELIPYLLSGEISLRYYLKGLKTNVSKK